MVSTSILFTAKELGIVLHRYKVAEGEGILFRIVANTTAKRFYALLGLRSSGYKMAVKTGMLEIW